MHTEYNNTDASAVADTQAHGSVEPSTKEVYMSVSVYEFPTVKACRSLIANGLEMWNLTLKVADLPLGWKYGPNARYANREAKPVKAMLETLRTEPEWFAFQNNGITVVADSLTAAKARPGGTQDITLEMHEPEDDEQGHGHGVVDGGHTYKALCEALSNEEVYSAALEVAHVVVQVLVGVPAERLMTLSQARNTSTPVPVHALRELAGDWDVLKAWLPEATKPLVSFKPNAPETANAPYDVTDLVRRLAVMNDQLFPAADGQHPIAAYNSVGRLVKQYSVETFAQLAPYLEDFLNLEERIVRYYEAANGQPARHKGALGVLSKVSGCSGRSKQLLTGYTSSITIADPFVLPVMAAFRVFLRPDLSGWVRPLSELWNAYGPKIIGDLWEHYKETGRSSASIFGRARSTWATASERARLAALQHGWMKLTDTDPFEAPELDYQSESA